MDCKGIPKKVVRHVQKAMDSLKSLQKPIRFPAVLAEVKFTMRNLVPVRDLDSQVKRCMKSIKNQEKSNLVSSQNLSAVKKEPNINESETSYGLVPNMSFEYSPQIFQCDASSQYSGKTSHAGNILQPSQSLRRSSASNRMKSIRNLSERRRRASIAKPSCRQYKAFKPQGEVSPIKSRNGLKKKYHVDSQGDLYSCTGLCKKALEHSPALAQKSFYDKLRSVQCQICKNPLKGIAGRSRYRL